jgi:hypothetical protein
MESLKRIAVIANLSLDMSELTRREKITATQISNNDLSWDASFAKVVEYVGENFKQPSSVDRPTSDNGKTKLGKWYINERNKSHTTARGDRMLVMKEITSILYIGRGRHLRNLGPSVKNNVKKMISELKSLSPS